MSYDILHHTADAKFQATAESLEEVFEETVRAFSEIVGGKGGNTRHDINIESESHESLLFDFLDSMIYLQDTEGVVVTRPESVEIEEKNGGYELSAVVWTSLQEPGGEYLDVKAPTYSEMEVDYVEGEGWRTVAVLDI